MPPRERPTTRLRANWLCCLSLSNHHCCKPTSLWSRSMDIPAAKSMANQNVAASNAAVLNCNFDCPSITHSSCMRTKTPTSAAPRPAGSAACGGGIAWQLLADSGSPANAPLTKHNQRPSDREVCYPENPWRFIPPTRTPSQQRRPNYQGDQQRAEAVTHRLILPARQIAPPRQAGHRRQLAAAHAGSVSHSTSRIVKRNMGLSNHL